MSFAGRGNGNGNGLCSEDGMGMAEHGMRQPTPYHLIIGSRDFRFIIVTLFVCCST
jgi:hypothetical protein